MTFDPKESMHFDSSDPIEIQVSIGESKYILREADGEAAVAYQAASIGGAQLNDDGKVSNIPATMASAEPLLVSKCLFYTDDKGNAARPVSEKTVRSWPQKIQRALYRKIKEISELDEADSTVDELIKQRDKLNDRIAKMRKDSAGNVPNSSTAGSD